MSCFFSYPVKIGDDTRTFASNSNLCQSVEFGMLMISYVKEGIVCLDVADNICIIFKGNELPLRHALWCKL